MAKKKYVIRHYWRAWVDITVEAENEDEAFEEADEVYNSGDYEEDPENFENTDVEDVTDEYIENNIPMGEPANVPSEEEEKPQNILTDREKKAGITLVRNGYGFRYYFNAGLNKDTGVCDEEGIEIFQLSANKKNWVLAAVVPFCPYSVDTIEELDDDDFDDFLFKAINEFTR